jgi:hypothetical protein
LKQISWDELKPFEPLVASIAAKYNVPHYDAADVRQELWIQVLTIVRGAGAREGSRRIGQIFCFVRKALVNRVLDLIAKEARSFDAEYLCDACLFEQLVTQEAEISGYYAEQGELTGEDLLAGEDLRGLLNSWASFQRPGVTRMVNEIINPSPVVLEAAREQSDRIPRLRNAETPVSILLKKCGVRRDDWYDALPSLRRYLAARGYGVAV